uniref:Erythroferrone n=1 Tax=Pelusios castaneus TaxID=367368 RepID=A0A8C8VG12_9SAUR
MLPLGLGWAVGEPPCSRRNAHCRASLGPGVPPLATFLTTSFSVGTGLSSLVSCCGPHSTCSFPGGLFLPLPYNGSSEEGGARSIDPRDAWMLFVKQSNKGVNSKKRGKGKSKTFKVCLHNSPPRIPPWPGPHMGCLYAGNLGRLKEAVKERERLSLKACDGCPDEEEERGEDDILALVAGPLAKSKSQHRVEAAFHCRIRRNISIDRRSLQELQIYYIPEKAGTFHRGLGLNLTSGHYTAPVAGYYTFTATVHIVHGEQQKKGQQRARDRLRVLICVQSLCQRNISLETVAGLDSNSELFSISVSGILYLQVGQYASVFVDNASGSALTVRSGSHFSAVLLGV